MSVTGTLFSGVLLRMGERLAFNRYFGQRGELSGSVELPSHRAQIPACITVGEKPGVGPAHTGKPNVDLIVPLVGRVEQVSNRVVL